ncbi:cytochrome P450 [Aspergillus recurvatus]
MATFSLTAGFIVTILFIQRLRSPIAKLPGPWYTTFTSWVLKYHEFASNRRLYIHNLHKRYGTAVRITPNEVSFASLEAIREIYASGGSGYDKTELYDLFRQFGIKTMFSTLDKHSGFVSRCAASAKSVDVYVLLHCYTHDGVTDFMFRPGGLRSLDSENDFEIMEELTYHQSLQKNLLHYYLPTLTAYFPSCLVPRRSPKTDEYVLRMSAQQRPSQHSLVAKLACKDSPLNHAQVAAECKDHMAAGIDTTGDGLCFLMWELSQPHNIRFQERLYEELRAADPNIPRKEALRCAPPIPMSFPRYVPAGGRSIDGHSAPEKTIVSCQPYTVQRLDESVFPEPDHFSPDRWIDEKGAAKRNRLFFAFSTGARGCTGRNLAMVEMKVLLREVYSLYSYRRS